MGSLKALQQQANEIAVELQISLAYQTIKQTTLVILGAHVQTGFASSRAGYMTKAQVYKFICPIASGYPVFALRSLQRVENKTLPIPTKAICNPT